MPELPEVEVTRRQIAPLLVSRAIARVRTTRPSYFFVTRPDVLRKRLPGLYVEQLDRHGKYLLARLDDGSRLLLHLGMTGQLFGEGAHSPRLLSSTSGGTLQPEAQAAFVPDPHTHLVLEFADRGPTVCFRDTRKFGKVQLLAPGASCARIDKLGIDALQATGSHLHAATRTRKAAIKSVLLDQGVLAGVGNIYADEALFHAGIRPTRGARRLSASDCDRLMSAVRRVLERSIETGGSSISDYVRPDGSDGAYQDERRVYARRGEPCLTCGARIVRTVLGQRSTCYCPRCQR